MVKSQSERGAKTRRSLHTRSLHDSMTIQIYSLAVAPHTTPIRSLCIENGLDFEIVETNPMTGAHKTSEFLKVTLLLSFSRKTRRPHLQDGSLLQMNPLHWVPTLKDGEFTMWESKSILRYVANKHQLEAWYPTEVQKRATIDLALDFCANIFQTICGPKLAYPAAGWAGPLSS